MNTERRVKPCVDHRCDDGAQTCPRCGGPASCAYDACLTCTLMSIGEDVLTDYAATTCDNVERCACSMGRLWRAMARCCENGTPGDDSICDECDDYSQEWSQ